MATTNAALSFGTFFTGLFQSPEDADLYRYVCLTAALMVFHYTMTGFIAAGSKRTKIFNKEYMERNFKTLHERFFPGTDLPKGGYPDMGNGRYSEKLSYKEWFEFNVGQRIHYNYLECIT